MSYRISGTYKRGVPYRISGSSKSSAPYCEWELKTNCAIIAHFSLNSIDIIGFIKYNNSEDKHCLSKKRKSLPLSGS